METYFDILPSEPLYNIIYYMKDKYEINKFIIISKEIKDKFSNDDIWKEMLYINLSEPIINKDHLWKDNYLDNLNIFTKYNIDHVDLAVKYDYVILFREINRTIGEIRLEVDDINQGFGDWVGNSDDRVAFISSSTDSSIYYVNEQDKDNYIIILNYLINNLKISSNEGFIGFHIDDMKLKNLDQLVNDNANYGYNDNDTIFTLKIGDLNIVLFDTPM